MENIGLYQFQSRLETKDGMFIKELAKTGTYIDSHGNEVTLDADMFAQIVSNFSVSKDKVPVPLGHQGLYDPLSNAGWVKRVWLDGDSLWGEVSITNKMVLERVNDGTIQDSSIGIFRDSDKGWVLEHLALTSIPAIAGLSEFEPVAFREPEAFTKFAKAASYTFSKAVEIKKVEKGETDMSDESKDKAVSFEKEKLELEVTLEKKNQEIATLSAKVATLENEKAEFEAIRKRNSELEDKMVDIEVSALVGKKILPTQVEFAKSLMKKDEEMFKKFIAESKLDITLEDPAKATTKVEVVEAEKKAETPVVTGNMLRVAMRKGDKAEVERLSKLLEEAKKVK